MTDEENKLPGPRKRSRRRRARRSRAAHQQSPERAKGVLAGDQHFESLAQPFVKNIYGSYKGRLRLALLREDLLSLLKAGETLLDVGAGIAQLSAESRQLGVDAYALDAAAEMREQAEAFAQAHALSPWGDRYAVTPLQRYELPDEHAGGYDWVWCHAVLAWLQEPVQALTQFARWVKPGGCLSLLFYNRDSMVLQQIFRGRYGYLEKMWARAERQAPMQSGEPASQQVPVQPFYPGGLTPQTPLDPAWVCDQLTSLGFTICFQRGVRCFADYMHADVRDQLTEAQLLAIERTYRSELPYRAMSRYIHVVARRPVESA